MSECDCVLEGDTPASEPRCGDTNGGMHCTRPEGHDGPHSACNPAEHPATTWEAE